MKVVLASNKRLFEAVGILIDEYNTILEDERFSEKVDDPVLFALYRTGKVMSEEESDRKELCHRREEEIMSLLYAKQRKEKK